jgi:hypothetical protein
VRGCGAHVFSSMRLPPADRATEVFEGAGADRVPRLVDTLFDVYERVGTELERARPERGDVQVLDDWHSELDATLDALVREALGPRAADARVVASVRALTDVSTWRALHALGASPEEAAQQATAAVERWLAASPAGAASARPPA